MKMCYWERTAMMRVFFIMLLATEAMVTERNCTHAHPSGDRCWTFASEKLETVSVRDGQRSQFANCTAWAVAPFGWPGASSKSYVADASKER